MIVLIYNLAATARQDFFYPTRETHAVAYSGSPASFPSVNRAPDLRSARKGPMTLRQRFLAGYRVDVNKAPMAELSELPGISDRVATAVILERTRLGRFSRPSDLLEVPGIKEKRLQIILPFLTGFVNN